ncbi:putative ABC transport system permease protein [Eubacterium ruminantium]|nr:putative ABC transport system permease protein [Eubacterium ruminantium]
MLRFIFRKLLSNKGLNISLFTGIIFLIAVFSMLPAFSDGAVNQILTREFNDYVEEKNEFPAVVGREAKLSNSNSADIKNRIASNEEKWKKALDLPVLAAFHYMSSKGGVGQSVYGGRSKDLDIACIPELSDITTIVREDGPAFETGNKAYPVYISERTMDMLSLVAGEEIYFSNIKDENEEILRLYIAGIIKEKEESKLIWYKELSNYQNSAFVDEETFDEINKRFGRTEILYSQYMTLDYRKIRFDNADKVAEAVTKLSKDDTCFSYNFKEILSEYKYERKTIRIIMLAAALPLFILLLMFILMVASRIADNEKGEIAVLRSRGVKRWEMIMLYLIRSVILAIFAFIPGILLGTVFVWIGSQTNGFLVFVSKDAADYYMSIGSIIFAAIGVVAAVILITLPVIRLSKNTIIDNKNENMSLGRKPLWKKLFLDVILTAVSVYLLHNYKQQTDTLSVDLINGKSIDPFIMMGSAIFIFGIGLLLIRIIDILVKIIFFSGRKHWGAASFAGFLQIIRSGSRQSIISIFIMLTLAMGIFDTSLARTINDNNVERITYNTGADARLTGNFVKKMRFLPDFSVEYYYEEPNYSDFQKLVDNGVFSQMTRVFYDEAAEVICGNTVLPNTIMMGINTAEFGRTATLQEGLNDTHWYNALNAIATAGDGFIISKNLAETLDVKVGDKIYCNRYDKNIEEGSLGEVGGTIMAIVDAWPGYEKYGYSEDEDHNMVLKENYLVVMNFATVKSYYKLTPYQVWGRYADGADRDTLMKAIGDNDIAISKKLIQSDEIKEMKDSAMIQITNGLFSIHFIISIIICVLGFLIYWITSIRNRSLQFGIYRAMGLKFSEIIRILVMEHFFSSFLAIVAGAGAGILTSYLYSRVMAIVYLPAKHSIPIRLSIPGDDILKPVAIILVALFVAFIIISRIMKKMRISETLKMGED